MSSNREAARKKRVDHRTKNRFDQDKTKHYEHKVKKMLQKDKREKYRRYDEEDIYT